jgi:hypothetical protein
MKYSINIDQINSIEWGFNLSEAAVFAYLFNVPTWADPVLIGGKTFYFAARQKTCQDVPLISDKPDTIYRIYKSLHEKGVIDYLKWTGKDCMRITEKGKGWNSEKNPSSTIELGKKSGETRKIFRINSEKNPTYNNTIYNSTNDKDKELVESYNSTVVVHDQVDEIGLQVHDVIDDSAALLPQLDVDEGKEEKSKKKKAAAKNPDPTPINAMWDILLEQSAKIGNDEPQFMSRYGRDFKLLYAILKQRAEKRNEPITDQVEPFRRYVTKIVDYIIKGRKVPQHQFTANNLARNFNPGYLHTSFNQICATIQSGVTVTNQPNKPTVYNESEVYRNFDSSQAAF